MLCMWCQGINFQLSAVLLSLGLYTYIEYCKSTSKYLQVLLVTIMWARSNQFRIASGYRSTANLLLGKEFFRVHATYGWQQ
jgi:hypothetical protein